jgi:hypothetical protein
MLAVTRGITIGDTDDAELTERFASMPPHPCLIACHTWDTLGAVAAG